MELPVRPSHLHQLIAEAEKRRELIRLRMAWVEERRRELWRRMDSLEATSPRVRVEIDPVPTYPLG
jgi:hypothetical protein